MKRLLSAVVALILPVYTGMARLRHQQELLCG